MSGLLGEASHGRLRVQKLHQTFPRWKLFSASRHESILFRYAYENNLRNANNVEADHQTQPPHARFKQQRMDDEEKCHTPFGAGSLTMLVCSASNLTGRVSLRASEWAS